MGIKKTLDREERIAPLFLFIAFLFMSVNMAYSLSHGKYIASEENLFLAFDLILFGAVLYMARWHIYIARKNPELYDEYIETKIKRGYDEKRIRDFIGICGFLALVTTLLIAYHIWNENTTENTEILLLLFTFLITVISFSSVYLWRKRGAV